jgi:signal transduction histidine kinase
LQLETSARVSREIAAILDMDRLLAHIVEDIRAAFDYYIVSIFLLEADLDQLKLKAISGGAEGDLRSQGLTIPINNNSLNGRAVMENQAVVVNDVFRDSQYRAISLLPDTRSELIIPLRIGKQVIGTLDVQSKSPDEFLREDVLVIQSLGDQIAIAIENARLVEQSQELAVLEERTRLARELHDSVAQSLFSIDLSARAVSTYLKKNRAKADEELQLLRKTAHDALQEMRSLIFGLRPVSFKDTGLVEAIQNEISRLQQRGGSEIVLLEQGICPLTARIEHHLFRIVQETVRNALVHSKANKITVKIGCDDHWVQLSVWDDGKGFDIQQALDSRNKNYGLVGLYERVEMLHGELAIDSSPGKGSRIDVRLPRPRNDSTA